MLSMLGSLKVLVGNNDPRAYRGAGVNLEWLKHVFDPQLQPRDVGAFGSLKAAYREEVERLYRRGVNTVDKQHFTSLYGPAREILQTPVTSEALTSLRSLIEQDIHMLDEPTKFRVQKLANAAQKSFAECALLLGENRLLFQQNNETNCRQSTRSTVFGKGKAKRDAKAAIVVKSKPGRKRKASAPEVAQAKRTRKSELEAAEEEIEALEFRNHCSVLQL
ncbi:hypothetical protein K469DRAFT_732707 [Zopfia rhizophila CBS 207.26]|uniref:Uncharacterized protein n=1 Tax=Zopfia rhizophila CBS 207.26 TaxID=1314779 RepID=A0A6A6EMZ6_9PEZI|nr:hypothetical protein K469DRAFT_732707 [Zopfia rhizophila CBS 207.26]